MMRVKDCNHYSYMLGMCPYNYIEIDTKVVNLFCFMQEKLIKNSTIILWYQPSINILLSSYIDDLVRKKNCIHISHMAKSLTCFPLIKH